MCTPKIIPILSNAQRPETISPMKECSLLSIPVHAQDPKVNGCSLVQVNCKSNLYSPVRCRSSMTASYSVLFAGCMSIQPISNLLQSVFRYNGLLGLNLVSIGEDVNSCLMSLNNLMVCWAHAIVGMCLQ